MSLARNKNFSRANSEINLKPIHSTSSISFIDSFKHRMLSNIFQRMPKLIKTLANLCQILDDYSLTEIKIEQIQQGTMDCILWNDDHSHPIAIDQNNNLIHFRQSIRESIHEFLEFTQEILLVYDKNDQINLLIEKSLKYLFTLNEYRTKRQLAFHYFNHHDTLEDAMLIFKQIDTQQFHQLRFIALHLRQFFLKLIIFIKPKFSMLE